MGFPKVIRIQDLIGRAPFGAKINNKSRGGRLTALILIQFSNVVTDQNKMEIPLSQIEIKEEVKVSDIFDTKNFQHILPEGESDFSDFEEEDKAENPELFMTDEQVEEVFNKELTEKEKKIFLEYKEHYHAQYLQQGQIVCVTDMVRGIIDGVVPGIPTTTQVEQEDLRRKLLEKARTKEELRERGVIPERKPKKRVRTKFLGPAMERSEESDGTIVIKIVPGRDPYEDLEEEEDKDIEITGMESASEEEPDEESADDLSCITIDSLSNIDKAKIKDLWERMSKTKQEESNVYKELADLIDDMSPEIIQETIKKTPKPGSGIPTCVDELYEEMGDSSKFRKLVACGFMMYEVYMKSKKEEYKPLTVRAVAKKFSVDIKGLMEIRRGEAYEREKKKMDRVVKKEEQFIKSEDLPEPQPSEGYEYQTAETSGLGEEIMSTQKLADEGEQGTKRGPEEDEGEVLKRCKTGEQEEETPE